MHHYFVICFFWGEGQAILRNSFDMNMAEKHDFDLRYWHNIYLILGFDIHTSTDLRFFPGLFLDCSERMKSPFFT
jgi:hypothetical protein